MKKQFNFILWVNHHFSPESVTRCHIGSWMYQNCKHIHKCLFISHFGPQICFSVGQFSP